MMYLIVHRKQIKTGSSTWRAFWFMWTKKPPVIHLNLQVPLLLASLTGKRR